MVSAWSSSTSTKNPETLRVRCPRPHPAQAQIERESRRFNVVVCGRRFGKTTLGLRALRPSIKRRRPIGWFAPTYDLLKGAWEQALRMYGPMLTSVNKSEHTIRLVGGAGIDFRTLDDPQRVGRSRKYDLVIIDEAALVRHLEEAWGESLRASLSDYRGGAWFLSTPKGANFFKTLYDQATTPEWARWRIPTSANPHIHPDEIEAARAELPSSVFRQEFLAEFVTDFGAVYRPPTYYQPDELPKDGYREATGCDFAYTSKAGDWTAFITGREANGVIYVTDLYRAQAESTEWATRLQTVPNPFAFIGGQEKGISDFLRRDYAIRLRTERAATDKLSRAMPSVTAWNRGEIRLPARAPITTEIEGEVLAFTGNDKVDAHDDIVDALAALHHALIGNRKTDLTEARRKAGLA